MRMQQKYLDQFYMLYDDFHITKLPLLPEEVNYTAKKFEIKKKKKKKKYLSLKPSLYLTYIDQSYQV
jgi:anion-transporting  ArsA/GET3 family ATPase